MNRNIAILCLILTTIFWGSTFAFSKEIQREMSSLWLVALRFSFTAICLFILFFRQIIKLLKTTPIKELLLKVLLLGIINFFAITIETIGVSKVPASNASFIASTSVLLVPFIEYFFRKKSVSNKMKLAILISIFGIYIMFYGFGLPKGFILDDIIIFVSAAFYSVQIVLIDISAKRFHSGALMFFLFLVTGIISLPLAILFDNSFSLAQIPNLSINAQVCLILIILIGTVIPYILMAKGQSVVDAQTAALLFILVPVFAMIISFTIFKEDIVIFKILGGLIIIIAQIIGVLKFRKVKTVYSGV